ncbi:hypothetical protein NLU13_3263 [Sarocladium strictum]|uniref:Uncharacterized protein n=1 Tax=Sarocladium strictum TaxID=5046 RepID=A0AA39LA91_SARSR|nr:hypothetical protein NLU13_3263 [Sarocladium strictum]
MISSETNLAPDILQLLPATGPLLDIALAIGALEASRKGSARVRDKGEDPKRARLVIYGRSIRAFRDEIATPGFQPAEKTLWITFLLGLFELMSETSSTEAWSMHMIQGLGQVIRYMTLIAEPIRLTKELLNIYRGLEISRMILYGTDTMLALGQDLGRSDASDCPKLVMFQELMLEASLLSHRMFRELSTCTHGSSIATAWASRGDDFFRKLRDARLNIENLSHLDDPFEKLAMANWCALCLYFCRNFSYFTAFAGVKTPALTVDETENLISTILDQLETLILRQEVHGVFLLYPLRVAGTSARSISEKGRIIKALKDVYTQGLAVSEWIVTDLQHLWE